MGKLALKRIQRQAKNKTVIFVDYFDTVMFRQIHSHQLMSQWEIALKKVYPQLANVNLCQLRRELIKELGKDECAIPYKVLMGKMLKKLLSENCFISDLNSFIETSYKIDYSIDMVTQYPNKDLIKLLKGLKKTGKKIYIVSDYYLPGSCYKNYLHPYRLDNFFDGIFCSSDFQKTKANGDLYEEILSSLAISSADVIMIGDSQKSDVENALKAGLAACRYFPLFHKFKTNIRKRTKYSYSKHIGTDLFKNCFDNTLFGEYSFNIYYFIKKLHKEIKTLNADIAYFLARGGFFLKKCFDEYNELLPEDERIKSIYLKNSRKVNKLALQYEQDRELLKKYLGKQIQEHEICVVDEGWYCTSQIIIERLCNYKIHGFYIGIMGRNREDSIYNRKGILFDINEDNIKSPLYGVFRTNCTFYEQLLSAPHGSTIKYQECGDDLEAIEDWQEIEKINYYKNIEPMQETISDFCLGLQCWNADFSLYDLSKYVMKTLLFGSDERIYLLKEINDSWYDNANDTKEKKFGKLSDVKISFLELIIQPENYLRYFCKVKELKINKSIMRLAYPIIGPVLYMYCRLGILKYKGIN